MNLSPETFLAGYDDTVFKNAMLLRQLLHENLPGITEQVDLPAKMIAFCYGQKYTELICVIIPSKKGLKLGFNKGNELPDPDNLLEGTGKISRYVVICDEALINSKPLKHLIQNALAAYEARTNKE